MLVKSHRTVTCAPTNTAVVEVASRVLSLIEESSGGGGDSGKKCFLSDMVLFGNEDRMAVDDNLCKIFMDSRVRRLRQCLVPGTGWTTSLSSMLQLLEHPLVQYGRYVDGIEERISDLVSEENKMRDELAPYLKNRKELTNQKKIDEVQEMQKKILEIQKKVRATKEKKMTFKTYFQSNYTRLVNDLRRCLVTFGNDLPRSAASEENFRCMAEVPPLLNAFGELVKSEPDEKLQALFKNDDDGGGIRSLFGTLLGQVKADVSFELKDARSSCVKKLRHLSLNFELPEMYENRTVEEFLLQRAKSVLCTASSSYRLHCLPKAQPFDVVVVDEAAQLKECESLIPLQLPGVRHAVLIGDQYQLPALVKSKVTPFFLCATSPAMITFSMSVKIKKPVREVCEIYNQTRDRSVRTRNLGEACS